VAYVRKVRTASGAVAVQVARKDAGRVVVLTHVGSARTDAELGILLEQARRIVTGDRDVFDFEVSSRAVQLGEVADYHREQTLLGTPDKPGRTKGRTKVPRWLPAGPRPPARGCFMR
jgi:hypothetical protein